jgi:phosphatidylethanolamine-binding protein (PEBP) family uncharacterized protein
MQIYLPQLTMNTARSKTRKHTTFNVSYESVRVNGNQLTRVQTAMYPTISFKPKRGKYYTIMMYDLHSPKPAFLHFLAINVVNPFVIDPIVPYVKPSPPPKDNHYHVYLFELYEQPEFLTLVEPLQNRSGFDPARFVHKYGLVKVAQRGFYINPQFNESV